MKLNLRATALLTNNWQYCRKSAKVLYMQNEQTLIDLGFKERPEWHCQATENKTFSLLRDGKTFVAYVNYWENPQYVTLGIFLREKGKSFIVDRWRQCCSAGSVERKIALKEKLTGNMPNIN